jgi:hypothetical protein
MILMCYTLYGIKDNHQTISGENNEKDPTRFYTD